LPFLSNYCISTVPEPIDPLYDKLTQLHITETDVEDVLQLFDTTKATGPDLINPRLVRGLFTEKVVN
jgi:hypothetical protein